MTEFYYSLPAWARAAPIILVWALAVYHFILREIVREAFGVGGPPPAPPALKWTYGTYAECDIRPGEKDICTVEREVDAGLYNGAYPTKDTRVVRRRKFLLFGPARELRQRRHQYVWAQRVNMGSFESYIKPMSESVWVTEEEKEDA